ncbi:MAG: hypothetical protein A2589_00520 [Candidatus Vogelbacteria bacterium RIFOXYD1_FULL_46_19]|uniref:Methyltransferase domain-containing protein n=1 Tax=Candidatus Vogelbacteria bacterium RIFOXYD1_FULL_46_19 TaxID=1802439 RepID=A0A1G2QJA3_9BACT|nr:MAG: hypothetical protein A2589_00520 [Candidatus Vogelbacteria bacterium RIFOXYD1_FULL_46_19]
MITTEEKTRKKFNSLKKHYDKTWDPKHHTLHVGLFSSKNDSLSKSFLNATEHLINKVNTSRTLDSRSVVLDIGCGTGQTLIDICLKYHCKGIGVDISDEMIKEANKKIKLINSKPSNLTAGILDISFIRSRASNIDKKLAKQKNTITHIISQDAIFLIPNKSKLFSNLYELMAPGGVMVIADFLSNETTKSLNNNEAQLIKELVNWDNGLSSATYKRILKRLSFSNIKIEQKNEDMVNTYKKLAHQMDEIVANPSRAERDLKNRYLSIVSAVKSKKIGWAFITAHKGYTPKVLVAGTKKYSLGRTIGNQLKNAGWDVWLYSRSAKIVSKKLWHERVCNINSASSVKTLLKETSDTHVIIFSADPGNGKGDLENLTVNGIKDLISTKLSGSLLLLNALLKNRPTHKIKLIWLAGKPTAKHKHLINYSVSNSALLSLVSEINRHYQDIFEAYYLNTPLISPSTLGDAYINTYGQELKKLSTPPKAVTEKVLDIINGKISPGLVNVNYGNNQDL